ncbi:hypothetical protein FQA47_005887 [Oryzias melastigma]|uniref:Uncharacterized protein n=1 Tax=Oryzias melastigma TaxID=30732 RepID=A0A834L258_ORYME|nr:hypothetical protein FQA47_005887 [Oryzias melastigma]
MSGGEQENQQVRSQSARPKNRRGENKHGTQNQSATERDSETSSPPDPGYDHGDVLTGVIQGLSHLLCFNNPPCQQHLKAGTGLSETGEIKDQSRRVWRSTGSCLGFLLMIYDFQRDQDVVYPLC